MNIKDDDLPPLPKDEVLRFGHTTATLQNYARAAIEQWAARQAPAANAEPTREIVQECRRVLGSTDGRKEPGTIALAHWVMAKVQAAPATAQAQATSAEPVARMEVHNPGAVTYRLTDAAKRLPPGEYLLHAGVASVAAQAPAVPPAWISEQYGGEFDDMTAGQGYRRGWNDCRAATVAAAAPSSIEDRAQVLIEAARGEGKVIRIDLAPRQPLAMGNYDMVADVRDARGGSNGPMNCA